MIAAVTSKLGQEVWSGDLRYQILTLYVLYKHPVFISRNFLGSTNCLMNQLLEVTGVF